MVERLIEETAKQIVTRLALKAVLDVERSLGPWDVRIVVHGAENRLTGLFHHWATEVQFTARGQSFKYRLDDYEASDFRSQHLQALLTPSASALATKNASHARS